MSEKYVRVKTTLRQFSRSRLEQSSLFPFKGSTNEFLHGGPRIEGSDGYVMKKKQEVINNRGFVFGPLTIL